MQLRNWLIAGAGALVLGSFAVPSQAAPLGGVTSNLANVSGDNAGLVEQVHRRRYYRHYRYYRPYRRHYYRTYRYYRPYRYYRYYRPYHHGYYYRRHRPGFHLHFGF